MIIRPQKNQTFNCVSSLNSIHVIHLISSMFHSQFHWMLHSLFHSLLHSSFRSLFNSYDSCFFIHQFHSLFSDKGGYRRLEKSRKPGIFFSSFSFFSQLYLWQFKLVKMPLISSCSAALHFIHTFIQFYRSFDSILSFILLNHLIHSLIVYLEVFCTTTGNWWSWSEIQELSFERNLPSIAFAHSFRWCIPFTDADVHFVSSLKRTLCLINIHHHFVPPPANDCQFFF